MAGLEEKKALLEHTETLTVALQQYFYSNSVQKLSS